MADLIRVDNTADFGEAGHAGDVIFVHGLEGDVRATWMSDIGHAETFWPQWIAQAFPRCRVWSLDYGASATEWWGSAMRLSDRAKNVADRLLQLGIGTAPVIFIAHSLGGLVVKAVLQHAFQANSDATVHKLWQQTRGIAFLGTPHRGARLASVGRWLMFIRPARTIDDLVFQKPELRDLNELFRDRLAEKLLLRVYREAKRTRGLWIVRPESADPELKNTPCIPVDRNHNNICKPLNRNDQVYSGVSGLISEALGISARIPISYTRVHELPALRRSPWWIWPLGLAEGIALLLSAWSLISAQFAWGTMYAVGFCVLEIFRRRFRARTETREQLQSGTERTEGKDSSADSAAQPKQSGHLGNADEPTISKSLPASAPSHPSSDAKILRDRLLTGSVPALDSKLALLSSSDCHFIATSIATTALKDEKALVGLREVARTRQGASLIDSGTLSELVRTAALSTSLERKVGVLELGPDALKHADRAVLAAFFHDVFEIIERDRFKEVNKIVSPLVDASRAIPLEMRLPYFQTILRQADSSAHHGAPAAQRGIASLPTELARDVIGSISAELLLNASHVVRACLKTLLTNHANLAPDELRTLFQDFLELPHRKFVERHAKEPGPATGEHVALLTGLLSGNFDEHSPVEPTTPPTGEPQLNGRQATIDAPEESYWWINVHTGDESLTVINEQEQPKILQPWGSPLKLTQKCADNQSNAVLHRWLKDGHLRRLDEHPWGHVGSALYRHEHSSHPRMLVFRNAAPPVLLRYGDTCELTQADIEMPINRLVRRFILERKLVQISSEDEPTLVEKQYSSDMLALGAAGVLELGITGGPIVEIDPKSGVERQLTTEEHVANLVAKNQRASDIGLEIPLLCQDASVDFDAFRVDRGLVAFTYEEYSNVRGHCFTPDEGRIFVRHCVANGMFEAYREYAGCLFVGSIPCGDEHVEFPSPSSFPHVRISVLGAGFPRDFSWSIELQALSTNHVSVERAALLWRFRDKSTVWRFGLPWRDVLNSGSKQIYKPTLPLAEIQRSARELGRQAPDKVESCSLFVTLELEVKLVAPTSSPFRVYQELSAGPDPLRDKRRFMVDPARDLLQARKGSQARVRMDLRPLPRRRS